MKWNKNNLLMKMEQSSNVATRLSSKIEEEACQSLE